MKTQTVTYKHTKARVFKQVLKKIKHKQKLPSINNLSGWLLLKDALMPCHHAYLKTAI